MNIRILAALGAVIALCLPLASRADITWIPTHDEPGSRIVITAGPATGSAAAPYARPPRAGDISADREYVFMGEEGGWQIRPEEYRVEGSGLVHVDDPVGHWNRTGDMSLLTEAERIARHHSFGG